MRKEFQVSGEVRRATLYGSALGVYRLYINGKPVGNDYFTPDWTDYQKRVYYNTYDVTDLIRSGGPNAIGGVLGAGWYAGSIGWEAERSTTATSPRLFAQLEIEMADGTVQTIVTDDLEDRFWARIWKASFWPAKPTTPRKEIPGWAAAGTERRRLAAGGRRPVALPRWFQAFPGVTVQETGVLRPVKITEPKPGAFMCSIWARTSPASPG